MDYLISDISKYAAKAVTEVLDYKTAAVLIVFLILLALIVPGRKMSDRVALAFLVAYLSFTFASTVLLRAPSPKTGLAPYPFWSWVLAARGNRALLLEIVENIALFVPIGLAFGYLNRSRGRRQMVAPTVFAIAFSATIELLQFLTGVGLCEFDDIFGNTLGFLVGYAISHALCREHRHE